MFHLVGYRSLWPYVVTADFSMCILQGSSSLLMYISASVHTTAEEHLQFVSCDNLKCCYLLPSKGNINLGKR
jgi:hypothetical protein